jgi:cell division initiation protein
MFQHDDRRPTVTPLDLRQAKFRTSMRGFDKTEVTTLLEDASAGYDGALRENERLRQELARVEESLKQYRDLEGSLKTTLLSAQKVADDLRDNADKEAIRIVREAEGRADLMMQTAQARVADMQRELDALRLKRREAESGIEASINALRHTLEFVREQERPHDKVVPHRPRLEAAAS